MDEEEAGKNAVKAKKSQLRAIASQFGNETVIEAATGK
jgi:hypothetical protein